MERGWSQKGLGLCLLPDFQCLPQMCLWGEEQDRSKVIEEGVVASGVGLGDKCAELESPGGRSWSSAWSPSLRGPAAPDP